MWGWQEQRHGGGCILSAMVGQFQADPLIAKRLIDKVSDTVLANDTDFAMYAGNALIGISQFTLDKKNKTKIIGIQVWFASNHMAEQAYSLLTAQEEGDVIGITYSPAEYDYFGQFTNARTRALIGMMLGSDVYKGDISGFRISKLSTEIESIRRRVSLGHHINVNEELKHFSFFNRTLSCDRSREDFCNTIGITADEER